MSDVINYGNRLLELISILKEKNVIEKKDELLQELGVYLFNNLPRIPKFIVETRYLKHYRGKTLWLKHVELFIHESGNMKRMYGRPTINQLIADLEVILGYVDKHFIEYEKIKGVMKIIRDTLVNENGR